MTDTLTLLCRCTKIKNMRTFYCERYCPTIDTSGNNVYVQYGNNVYTGKCERLVAHTAAMGAEPGSPVTPTEVWSSSDKSGSEVVLVSCHSVTEHTNSLRYCFSARHRI